ncbi:MULTISPECIES: Hsp33 family molecular chaperone HslO [Brochothrix]|uniref:33 kDa chaperonin n=1 Tax=Brochothrix thermosphacta TaxID=2756 RepID=A0A1D2KFB8_BROTH|nr:MULTISPECIES: Hsp33 family molecular chaperone HslO [Brochothrix]SLM93575.1 Chaperonin (heat shock protein 33) [Brachybacterium faecium]ANZ95082.1 Hsp33 family molecular chaperone [Brochothrix thermosphacta]ANZ96614.1 Hsp33 family molecular chaperone [Brochothrix thermosphacta]ATF26032.1 Hsp33 family molecular chaperone HslO [Brochothrix thermosphacta]ATH85372.1 Hsp33 family molecular chaperone HslO [Brochothrix thermosphacta]
MKDYLIKAVACDSQVRAFAAITTNTVGEAQSRHNTLPVTSAALGRSMTGALMLGMSGKGDQKITLKIEGDGPIGAIIADSDAHGKVRGYVQNPHVHFTELNESGKLDVRRGVGTTGTVTVTKDIGMREKINGQVPLISGEISEDITYYLATSEQIPSAVGAGVLVNPDATIQASGGFMIQLLPNASDEVISQIENKLAAMPTISKLIDEGRTPEEILTDILGDDVKVLEKVPVEFECVCSKERFSSAIVTLGEKEIRDMIEEDGGAEASCHFCGNKYDFSVTDLEGLIEETKNK